MNIKHSKNEENNNEEEKNEENSEQKSECEKQINDLKKEKNYWWRKKLMKIKLKNCKKSIIK